MKLDFPQKAKLHQRNLARLIVLCQQDEAKFTEHLNSTNRYDSSDANRIGLESRSSDFLSKALC